MPRRARRPGLAKAGPRGLITARAVAALSPGTGRGLPAQGEGPRDAINAEDTREEAAEMVRSLIDTIHLIPGAENRDGAGRRLAGILAPGERGKQTSNAPGIPRGNRGDS